MSVFKLEDLIVWKKSLDYAKYIYHITREYPPEEKYNIKKHMLECARNVPGNIAEGFGRFHYKESSQFYRIARGSLTELRSDLFLSKSLSYLKLEEFDEAISQIDEISMLLNGLIRATQKLKQTTGN